MVEMAEKKLIGVLDETGRVVIPKRARDQAGFVENDAIEFIARPGEVRIVRLAVKREA